MWNCVIPAVTTGCTDKGGRATRPNLPMLAA